MQNDRSSQPRRSFLTGAAAAASLAAAAAPLGLAQDSTAPIRTAHIGVGSRGSSLLRQVLSQPNVRVNAICDADSLTRDQALTAAARDNPKSVSEWRAVLDLKNVDAVYIATPCDLHAEMAVAALEAGKHVYCEKPLGITPEQVDRVVKAARRARGVIFQIGQQLRYFPALQEAMAKIHDPALLGARYIIKAQRHSSRSRASAAAAAGETAQQRNRAAWYADVKRSGDLIVENSVHNIDACNWIANSRPVSAYGHGKKYFPSPAIAPGTQMMDGYSVEYIYENDMHLDYSQVAFHARKLKELPNGQWYTIYGEKGSVYLTHDSALFYDLHGDADPVDLLVDSKRIIADRTARGIKEPDSAIENFFACIREKRQPAASVTVGAVAALTAILGREAIYKRRMVTWKELGVEV